MTPETKPILFEDFGLSPKLFQAIDKSFKTPTPIQARVIPLALQGKDVIGIAQTGTGKTLAFGIPMLEKLVAQNGQGLILLPTRELALQVDEALRAIGQGMGLKTAVLIGGASNETQKKLLYRQPHIVVATPGRLMDHLEQRTFDLRRLSIIVLDEADRMFDIGFMPQITKILQHAPKDRQTLLFSATMPDSIVKIVHLYMKTPVRIDIAPQGTAGATIDQSVIYVSQDSKMRLLETILNDTEGTVLVFSRTKHGARKMTAHICGKGHRAAEIHSNRSLAQRKEALGGFKTGRYRVLVATDIAARGIDVQNISLVVNYDLPDCSSDYVHRIGRTGRAGLTGKAVSFATNSQRRDIKDIERIMKKSIREEKAPFLPPATRDTNTYEEPRDRERSYGRSRGFAPRRFERNNRPFDRNSRPFQRSAPRAPERFERRAEPMRSESQPYRPEAVAEEVHNIFHAGDRRQSRGGQRPAGAAHNFAPRRPLNGRSRFARGKVPSRAKTFSN
ncbi:MAG: DEAD/DEAH box helicase [Patescibacteria group bacterium]